MRGRDTAAAGEIEDHGASGALRRAGTRASKAPQAGRLTSAIVHEIRTPLAVALMYLRLVEDEAGPLVKESVRDGFSIARAEVARLDRLLTDLVDLHRVGHILIHPKLVDAGRIVSDAVRRVLRDLNAGQVTVELGASDLLDWWDPSAIERIVGSLVVNVAHQGEGRPVSVNVDRVGSDLRIVVHDGGPGVHADSGERPFRRRLGPRKARVGALDMSLWLVRELAEAHGGGVTADNREGARAAFTVTLGPHRP